MKALLERVLQVRPEEWPATLLALAAAFLTLFAAVFSRTVADAMFLGEFGIFIHVHLVNAYGVAHLRGHFFKHGGQGFARPAPRCPEIDHNGVSRICGGIGKRFLI